MVIKQLRDSRQTYLDDKESLFPNTQGSVEGQGRSSKKLLVAAAGSGSVTVGGADLRLAVFRIDCNAENLAVGVGHVRVNDEGDTFNGGFKFVFKIVAFVDAQPELHVAFSTSSSFNFTNAHHGFIVVFLFEERLQLLDDFGRESNVQHGTLR